MLFFITLFVVVTLSCNAQQLEFWLTDPDRNILFQNQTPISPTNRSYDTNENVITINITERYQTMDEFGYALTGGSNYHLYRVGKNVLHGGYRYDFK
jgi:glucosylceramidase